VVEQRAFVLHSAAAQALVDRGLLTVHVLP
jgi:hypothetical protein